MLRLKRVTQKVVEKAPEIIRMHIKFTPNFVLKSSLNMALNMSFKRSIALGELEFMCKKSVKINVTDLDFSFSINLLDNSLQVILDSLEKDVLFQASSTDLLLLMARKVDPDTLFFRRRLKISGDTELALALKNFLDTLDLSAMLPSQLLRVFNRLADGVDKPGLNH